MVHLYVSKQNVAKRFGVSTRTVERWIESGVLPAYRVGGQVRVRETDAAKLPKRIPTRRPQPGEQV